jgi:hypothetical protein
LISSLFDVKSGNLAFFLGERFFRGRREGDDGAPPRDGCRYGESEYYKVWSPSCRQAKTDGPRRKITTKETKLYPVTFHLFAASRHLSPPNR